MSDIAPESMSSQEPALEAASAAAKAAAPTPASPPSSDEIAVLPAPLPGEQLGPYLIEEREAIGGMGVVLRAVDTRDNVQVAIKLLHSGEGISERDRERFRIEARASQRLQHPHIVPVREVATYAGRDVIVMSFIHGRTLDRWVEEERPGPARIALLMEDVSRALHYAHELGLVHRDVKPSNILVDGRNHAFLTDFGLARDLDNPDGVTLRSEAIGTPPYMSPEQSRNDAGQIGPQTDIWSMGVVLYHALTGKLPFAGETVYQTFDAIVNRDPAQPHRVDHTIPRPLSAVTMRCLEKVRGQRYQTARALADDLMRFAAGATVVARTPSLRRVVVRRLRRNWLLFAMLLVLLAVIAGVARWRWIEHQQRWGQWTEMAVEDFRDGAIEHHDMRMYNATLSTSRPPSLTSGGLIFRDAAEPGPDWLWIQNPGLTGDLRIELELEIGAIDDAIEVAFNARHERLPRFWFGPRGFAVKVQSGASSATMLGRMPEPGFFRSSITSTRGLRSQAVQTLMITRRDGRIEVEADGERLLDYDDPLPAPAGAHRGIGIRAWQATTRLRSVRVHRLTVPPRPSPLLAGDSLLSNGHHHDAATAYLSLADAQADPSVAQLALVRAYIALQEAPQPDESVLAGIRSRVSLRFPESPYQVQLDQADALRYWRTGQHAKALEALAAVLDEQPRSRLLFQMLDHVRPRLAPADATRFLELVAQSPAHPRFDFSSMGLVDISPLAGLELVRLNLSDNPVSDLSALTGMPLRQLILNATNVVDLEPLRGMPLQELALDQSKVVDLGPLAGMHLQRLHARQLAIDDWAPLAHQTSLLSLNLNDSNFVETSLLASMSKLETLGLAGTGVTDFAPLVQLPLTALDLERTGIIDVAPLATAEVISLSLAGTAVRDLSPLRAMTHLERLQIAETAVESLAAVPTEHLREVVARDTQITDVSPLATAHQLERLDIAGTGVADLSALAGLSLSGLNIDGTNVSDLSPTESWPLRAISLANTPVETLPVWSRAVFQQVYLNGSAVTDLSALGPLPREGFDPWVANLTDVAIYQLLQRDDELDPPMQRLLEAELARRAAGFVALATFAVPFDDQRRVALLPTPRPIDVVLASVRELPAEAQPLLLAADSDIRDLGALVDLLPGWKGALARQVDLEAEAGWSWVVVNRGGIRRLDGLAPPVRQRELVHLAIEWR